LSLIFGSWVARSLRFVQGAGFPREYSAAALLASTRLRFQALDLKEWSEQKRVEKLRYIHRNPVKRGLVERPEDWFV
jgi:REP element-mobilizing transposase RayT